MPGNFLFVLLRFFFLRYTIPLSSKDVTKDGRPRASVRSSISVLWREKKSPTERTSQAETGRKAPSGATHRKDSGYRLATRLNRCKPRSNSDGLFFGLWKERGAAPRCVFYMPCGRPSQHEKIRCGASHDDKNEKTQDPVSTASLAGPSAKTRLPLGSSRKKKEAELPRV